MIHLDIFLFYSVYHGKTIKKMQYMQHPNHPGNWCQSDRLKVQYNTCLILISYGNHVKYNMNERGQLTFFLTGTHRFPYECKTLSFPMTTPWISVIMAEHFHVLLKTSHRDFYCTLYVEGYTPLQYLAGPLVYSHKQSTTWLFNPITGKSWKLRANKN
jgi:hypothetical protein